MYHSCNIALKHELLNMGYIICQEEAYIEIVEFENYLYKNKKDVKLIFLSF